MAAWVIFATVGGGVRLGIVDRRNSGRSVVNVKGRFNSIIILLVVETRCALNSSEIKFSAPEATSVGEIVLCWHTAFGKEEAENRRTTARHLRINSAMVV